MSTHLFRIQLVLFIALVAFCTPTTNGAVSTTGPNMNECAEAASLIHRLRFASLRKREKTKNSILVFSRRSSTARQCVVKTSLKIVTDVSISKDKGVGLFWKFPGRFQEWSGAADILGTLRASEAIDVLVECLDCNDGRFGLSVDRFPATRAIVNFGDEAIPLLARTLKGESSIKKYLAALALHEIAGEKAKEALEKAVSEEHNSEDAANMRNLLLAWKNRPKPSVLSVPMRPGFK